MIISKNERALLLHLVSMENRDLGIKISELIFKNGSVDDRILDIFSNMIDNSANDLDFEDKAKKYLLVTNKQT